MKVKADNYFLKSFEEIGLIGKHFDVYDNNDNLVFNNCIIDSDGFVFVENRALWATTISLLTGEYSYEITSKKKKLRDITEEEWDKWRDKNCYECEKCIFRYIPCTKSSSNNSWCNNKDLYSDRFLNQEIEVK